LWVWLFWLLLLILRNFLFPAGVVLPPGVLLCVCVRRPCIFGFSMGERTCVSNVHMGTLCGVGLCFYVSKVVGKWYLHGSGVLLFFSVSWVSGFCSWCVYSLLSVVLYTQVGVVLYSPCAWVQCISYGYSLEYVLCAVHCPLDFALCEFVHW
jgi:hypothetical protein